MANEPIVFRPPAGMLTQVVAKAGDAFLSSSTGMEVTHAHANSRSAV